MIGYELVQDNRLLNNPRYYLAGPESAPMQVVPDEVRKCVVFLAYKVGDDEFLAGTGFFLSYPITGTQRHAIYLVTAKHVIKGIESKTSDQKVYLRMNGLNGQLYRVTSDLSAWKFHPTDMSVDAAVLAWAPDPKTFDFKTLPITMAVTDEIIAREEIGAGDEVFLTGLFRNHYGAQKNLPIIRTGNIALMPEEKVHTNGFGLMDAYLIEARSIGGLSGSPVFAYLGYMRATGGNINMGGSESGLFCWLGIMHGHWDIDEDHVDSDIMGAVGKNINMGIGIVVPATKVLEILEGEEDFVKERKQAENEHRKSTAPVEDSIQDAPTSLTKDDFERTLRKVTRKVEESDEKKPEQ